MKKENHMTLEIQKKRAFLVEAYLGAKITEDIYFLSPNQRKYRQVHRDRLAIWKELMECK
jgi:hypothetical protein